MIIVAANAGGAWSPIGDITTTMLWIGEKVSIVALIKYLIIPSLVCMIIPTYVASKYKIFQGSIETLEWQIHDVKYPMKFSSLILQKLILLLP
jgi:Na+/H+ antiporter NhaD/arsenite permease-like protein